MSAGALRTKTERDNAFGVAIIRDDGSHFLALNGEGAAPLVHWERRDAVAHKKDLKANGFRTEIVPVKMQFTYELPSPRRAK